MAALINSFGQSSCYPVAFGVPALLMLTAVAVFVAGTPLYRHPQAAAAAAQGSASVSLGKVARLVWQRMRGTSDGGEGTPLQTEAPADEAAILQLLPIFVPILAFWALYDQQGSRWTYQAMLMEPHVWGLTIKPEQMQVINAVLILLLIPTFDWLVYPLIARLRGGNPLRPLQRMTVGLCLAIAAFLMAALLQWLIETRSVFMPNPLDPSSMTCVDGCIPILWQSWQYLALTSAEIMVSITGLEFAYSQAPESLKSLCQSLWLLTVAGGNLLVILINELDPLAGLGDHHMTGNFILWALILTAATLLFYRQAQHYVYREEMHTIPLS